MKNYQIVLIFIPIMISSIVVGVLIGSIINSQNATSTTFPAARYISDFQENQDDLATKVLVEKDSNVTAVSYPVPTVGNNPTPSVKSGNLVEDANRQVVKFNNTLTSNQIAEYEKKYNVKFTGDTPSNGIYVVNLSGSAEDYEALKSDPAVSGVEVDKPIQLLAQTTDWGVGRIGSTQVWPKNSGSGVIVAVVDTGVQLDHTDLAANIVTGFDFVNNDTSAYDDNGHGTHVAGIISGVDNADGIVGVSHSAKIMPIKVMNNLGQGYLSDIVKGINYAVDHGAKVINLSLGTTGDSIVLKDAVNYAFRKGSIVVAAAGNASGQPCLYPAAYDNAICVMATDQDNKLATFSNVGGEISAPGVSNYSTYLGNKYAYLSGTSMATPHVAGALANILAYCGDCTISEAREILRTSAADLGDLGKDILFGYGLVDLVKAYSLVDHKKAVPEPEPTPTPQPTPVSSPVTTPTPSPSPTPTPKPAPGEKNNENKSGNDKQTDNKGPGNLPGVALQKLKIISTEPEIKNRSNHIEVEHEGEVKIKFGLTPKSENSKLERINVQVNDEVKFTTENQEDEFTIKTEDVSNGQYLIRIIAYYKDNTKQQERLIIDMTKLKPKRNNSKANSDNNERKGSTKVLGVQTGNKHTNIVRIISKYFINQLF